MWRRPLPHMQLSNRCPISFRHQGPGWSSRHNSDKKYMQLFLEVLLGLGLGSASEVLKPMLRGKSSLRGVKQIALDGFCWRVGCSMALEGHPCLLPFTVAAPRPLDDCATSRRDMCPSSSITHSQPSQFSCDQPSIRRAFHPQAHFNR